jgi:glc operon protein GlcG
MLDGGDFAVTLMPGTAAIGGGVPIVHDGEIIGAIAASGDTVETDLIAAEAGAQAALA